jgi:P-type Ca2+ transporter type 2C
MTTTVNLSDGRTRMYTKGAPEVVVRLCDKQLDVDGTTVMPLDRSGQAAVIDRVEAMAARGLRTLLLAYRDVNHDQTDEQFWKEAPEFELTLIGIVGIKDPIRAETKEAVRLLKGAGVMVRMVTGDNPLTATFIAREAGILDDDGVVITGPEFRKMTSAQMDAIALKIQVLARSTPNDKLILVRELKKLGEVVAVTGDGTNDAPALKEAHIGFALGVAGTEIAKEACDIVILDDNIQSMAKAALWGRNVYESIRKFLQFQLVVNVVAVTLNVIAAIAGVQLPLSPVPLLWVNMIMDSMGALALATEPPRPQLMERKPFGRRAPLINRAMYRNIAGVAIYQLFVSLVLQFAGARIFGLECLPFPEGRSVRSAGSCGLSELNLNAIIFNTFVFMQIFSEINSRRIEERDVFTGILHSYMFVVIIGFTVAIQIALVLAVGGTRVGESIGIGHVSWQGWIASVVLGALILPWGYLVRCWPMEWCFGPLDEDPTEMSSIEKLFRIPPRKLQDFKLDAEEEGRGRESGGTRSADSDAPPSHPGQGGEDVVQSVGPGADELERITRSREGRSAAIVKLRVFVHAVAFVNAISKNVSVSEDMRSRPSIDPKKML